jgi:hypothetical protein
VETPPSLCQGEYYMTIIKQLLSIDFDYLLEKETKQRRELKDPFRQHKQWLLDYHADPDLIDIGIRSQDFDYLLEYLLKLDPNTPILISDSHADILTGIKNIYGGVLDPNLVYSITNVDHHHDIYYNEAIPYTEDLVGPANWVYYLYMQEKLKEYIWISNQTSEPFSDTHGLGFIYNQSKDITRIEATYPVTTYNGIFIARSSSWVPPHLLYKFTLFANVLTLHFKNIHWIKSPGLLLHEQPNAISGIHIREIMRKYDQVRSK